MTFWQALKKNPLFWMLCIMLTYFAIAGLELELKIPAYFEQKAHEKKMQNDSGYASDVVRIQQQDKLIRDTNFTNPKEQVEAMFAARKAGVPIEKGCTHGVMTYGGESAEAQASCIYSAWQSGLGGARDSAGDHIETILSKIEREGMPSAGVLKRWRMLADGCTPGDDSKWCKDFEKAMACTNACMGGQMVSLKSETY